MASIQRRCADCRSEAKEGIRACAACGSRNRKYIVRYYEGRKQKSKSFSKAQEAEDFRDEVAQGVKRGTFIDPAKGAMSLAEFYSGWLVRAMPSGIAPSTIDKYARTWRLYVEPLLGTTALARITKDDVRAMVEGASTHSPWQAAEALKLTRMLLNRAMDANRIGANPASRVKTPRVDRAPVRVLTPKELGAIVDAIPERWRALVVLGAYSSLRWSELVAVKRDDIDLGRRTVRVDEKVVEIAGRFEWGRPKTAGATRTVDLPNLVIPPLAEHMLRFPPLRSQDDAKLDGLLFYGERGGVVRRHVFRAAWRRACDEARVPGVRPEWLRRTGASLAYMATHDMKAVAARLGHTSTRMMDTVYVEVYPEASRAVADAIDALVEAAAHAE